MVVGRSIACKDRTEIVIVMNKNVTYKETLHQEIRYYRLSIHFFSGSLICELVVFSLNISMNCLKFFGSSELFRISQVIFEYIFYKGVFL